MKDAYYFPHDSNARQDPKIIALCSRYGLIAYACYFQAIEILREQINYRLNEKLGTAITTSWQCYGGDITSSKASSIFGDMFTFGLLELKEGFISSPSLINRMSHLDELRRKRSEAGSKGAAKVWQSHGKAIAKVWQSHGDPMAVKESKVNEKKVKESKEKTTAIAKLPQTSLPLTDIQKIVVAFKMLQGYPKDDKAWDRLNFARCSKSAKALFDFLGHWKIAADCCQDVYERLTSKGLTVTLETIIKHAAEWKKDQMEKGGFKHGILPVPGDGNSPIITGPALSTSGI